MLYSPCWVNLVMCPFECDRLITPCVGNVSWGCSNGSCNGLCPARETQQHQGYKHVTVIIVVAIFHSSPPSLLHLHFCSHTHTHTHTHTSKHLLLFLFLPDVPQVVSLVKSQWCTLPSQTWWRQLVWIQGRWDLWTKRRCVQCHYVLNIHDILTGMAIILYYAVCVAHSPSLDSLSFSILTIIGFEDLKSFFENRLWGKLPFSWLDSFLSFSITNQAAG